MFTAEESYLISLVSTEEECETICDAMPECTLAVFDPTSYKEINKCVPKKGTIGKAGERQGKRTSEQEHKKTRTREQ